MYLYDLTVDGYGQPAILGTMPWPLGTSLYVSSIVGASIQVHMSSYRTAIALMPRCQTVFTFRVQTITHNVWLALPAYINQLSRVAIGITVGILSYHLNDVVVFHDKYLFLVYMNLVPSVVVSFAHHALATVIDARKVRHLYSSLALLFPKFTQVSFPLVSPLRSDVITSLLTKSYVAQRVPCIAL
jgi:hypothetical protein